MNTVPQLLAFALTGRIDTGDHLCFYCGCPTTDTHTVADHVQETFTGFSDVAAPGSRFVCAGCILCLRHEATIDMIDGVKGRYVRMAAMRSFSWVITAAHALAASKAHLAQLRALCLTPPTPPFAIVLSDAGKKHLLYRGVVNHMPDPVTVTLEGEPITYQPTDLAARLTLCGKLIAATGKPALAESPSVRFAHAIYDYWGDNGLPLLTTWEEVHATPLSRLATWLSAGRDEQRQRYPRFDHTATAATPGHGVVPQDASRPG